MKVGTSRDSLQSSRESFPGDTAVSKGSALLALMSFQICSFKCSAQGIFVTPKHMAGEKSIGSLLFTFHIDFIAPKMKNSASKISQDQSPSPADRAGKDS